MTENDDNYFGKMNHIGIGDKGFNYVKNVLFF